MIQNKQYPFCHMIKTQDGTKIPSHDYFQRMSTPPTAGWFYEQKVVEL